MSKTAHIIAVRKRDVQPLVGVGVMGRSAVDLLMSARPWIGPRDELEFDTDFLQVIPYIVIKRGDKYLAYTRGTEGGENRLHGRISIGVGGHIDADDVVSESRFSCEYVMPGTMYLAMRRELEEEVGHNVSEYMIGKKDPFTHIIQVYETDVDKVHIGVVAFIEIPVDMALEYENTMENISWLTLEELHLNKHRLESWSALLVDELATVQNR